MLNESGTLRSADDWNDPNKTKLWLYNLHYFDYLSASDGSRRHSWHRALIERWIAENPPGKGVGWEPYPLSLRISNWIKWALSGNALDLNWVDSLGFQASWLEGQIEWHLLGNHLLANAKALILAGLFFEGPQADQWLELGSRILDAELDEQILSSDGGHFERSPMYHSIVLEDLVDLLNAACVFGAENTPIFTEIADRIGPMLSWLDAMTHPDGEIAFFNDAAFGVAPAPEELRSYADRLGLAHQNDASGTKHLQESGYLCADHDGFRAILDIAPIGPDYLPGHAHADTLSFELSVGSDRVVVNGGTSTYETNEQRLRERGTAAHSTVIIDDEDSSEVWAAFRVARRARVMDVSVANEGEGLVVTAAHDGYRRLSGRPIHRRTWAFSDRRLSVKDEVQGAYRTAVARYHLGPGVSAAIEVDATTVTLTKDGKRICDLKASVPIRRAQSEWHPEFGLSVPIDCVELPFDDAGSVEAEFIC